MNLQLPVQLVKVIKVDYELNERTRNNGAKLILKYFNTSVVHHFYQIKNFMNTTWNALPSEVVSSRTVTSFKNSLDKHFAENAPMSE